MSQAFQKVPILDWKLIEHGQKSDFILQLREALVHVGFFYIEHPPIEPVGSDATYMVFTNVSLGSNSTREGVCTEAVRAFRREETSPSNVKQPSFPVRLVLRRALWHELTRY
jgi:hypothetical protein